MNGFQRIHSALAGTQADTVPIMLHNFMMAAREAGYTMSQFRKDPQIMARCFIQSVEKYGFDGMIVDMDTATLAGAAGVPVDFPDDEPARTLGGYLKSLEEVKDLEPTDILSYEPVQVWLEAVRLIRKWFGDEVYIRGNCDQAPFSLACMMRGYENWMTDLMMGNQELLDQLLDYTTAICGQFITQMACTGCHMVSNGDSLAGPEIIAPEMYERFALPGEQHVVQIAHDLGLPHTLHICGNTGPILQSMISSGADAFELDYKTDIHLIRDLFGQKKVFIGNIDPSGVLALGDTDLIRKKTRELLQLFSDTPRFILNAGCAIPPFTPPDNLRAMIQTAREFK